jgi:hypothetical protein
MHFIDAALCIGTPNPNNIYGTEFFYWSPKFPILAFEMANRVIQSYKTTEFKWLKQHQKTAENWRTINYRENHQILETSMKYVLYDTWDNKFQSNKPIRLDRSDKNFWIYQSSELSSYKDAYIDMFNMHAKNVRSNDQYSLFNEYQDTKLYKRCETKNFFVLRDQ